MLICIYTIRRTLRYFCNFVIMWYNVRIPTDDIIYIFLDNIL